MQSTQSVVLFDAADDEGQVTAIAAVTDHLWLDWVERTTSPFENAIGMLQAVADGRDDGAIGRGFDMGMTL